MIGMNNVYTRTYRSPKIDRREILRYAGIIKEAPDIEGVLDECIAEVERKLVYRVCYAEFELKDMPDHLDLGFAKIDSGDLKKHLESCCGIIVFAATVGIEIDRAIYKYSKLSPAKAVLLQAIGAERIEALCDAFCEDMAREKSLQGAELRRRFSPGYGDLDLGVQRDIFAALDCQKRIGISLNDSLLISPSKSVTAIIGIDSKNDFMKGLGK